MFTESRTRTSPRSSALASRRALALLAVAVLALVAAACGGGDDAADTGTDTGDEASLEPGGDETTATEDDGSDADPDHNATEGEAPVVRLVSVTYNGNPRYEFRYDDDGAPIGHTNFHPVTGQPRSEYTVVETDEDGNVTELSIENLDVGNSGREINTYDDEGRILSQTYLSDTTESTTTYDYDGSTVTLTSSSGNTLVFELDSDGNITTSTSTNSGRTTVITNLEFDDTPNPFNLTGGQLVQVYSTNNALRWSPDAGCEYTEEFTYDGDLLVASRAEGCADMTGTPIVHEYIYEYEQF